MTRDAASAAPTARQQRPRQRSKIAEEFNALGIDADELKGVMGWQMRVWAVIYLLLGIATAAGALWSFVYTWIFGRNFLGGIVLLAGIGVVAALLIYSGLKTWRIFGGMK